MGSDRDYIEGLWVGMIFYVMIGLNKFGAEERRIICLRKLK